MLSVCCNTIERHEVLCCWEMLQGAGGDQTGMIKPWLCSLMLRYCQGLGLQGAQPSCRAAFPPFLLFQSLLMLFIERGSFLSCKILVGGYSQTDRTFWGSGCWWRCCTPCSAMLVSCAGLSCLLGQLLVLQVQPLHTCREEMTFFSGLFDYFSLF